MRVITITKKEAGQRLDKMLSRYLNQAGKGFLYKMMRKKNITLNGRKCDGSEKLSEGDEVKLFLAEETIEKFSSVSVQKVKKTKLDIIYEDDHVLFVNKPSGMLSQKARDTDESLVEYITDYLLSSGQLTEEGLKTFRPSVCNRLDRNTSGLVAAGKSMAGLQILGEVFKDRSIHKYYLCLVKGRIDRKKRIRGYLWKDERTNQVTIYETEHKGSLPIETEYDPLGSNGKVTLLKVALITGRSHQIRAHLASQGHPVIGDVKYGDKEINEEWKRKYRIRSQMLHSWNMALPKLREPLSYLSGKSITAPLPEDFKRALAGEKGMDALWEHGIQEA